MRALGAPIRQDKEAQAYIINYGSVEAMRRRRKALMTDRGYLEYDLSHVTFVDGSYRKNIKTIIWIVPKGAPIPTP